MAHPGLTTIIPPPCLATQRHILSYNELEKVPHFEENFQFRQHTTDKVTGMGIVRVVDITTKPKNDLRRMLMSSKAGADDQKLVLQLADLLDKILGMYGSTHQARTMHSPSLSPLAPPVSRVGTPPELDSRQHCTLRQLTAHWLPANSNPTALDPEKRMTVGQALKHNWSDTSFGKAQQQHQQG